MPFTVLPPVRTRVPLRRTTVAAGRQAIEALFPTGRILLLGSGTQALGAALRDAAMLAKVARPEAIIPAYACPDLVTACVAAGVRPRIVDVDGGGWGYDQARLGEALGADTVAVVAVNLLGLGDDAARIAPLAASREVRLVHDSAQWFPDSVVVWQGDSVVLSFGRGKPLNLLGGGALVQLHAGTASCADQAPSGGGGTGFAGALAFNAMSHPLLYGLVTRMPFLGVGSTRYREPQPLQRQPEGVYGRLGEALAGFPRAHAATPAWEGTIARWASLGVQPLTPACGTPRRLRLRQALLARDRKHRDSVLKALHSAGLGASPLYDRILPQITGLPAQAAEQGPFPNAERLAARLFTLPTHSLVTANIIARTDAALRSV